MKLLHVFLVLVTGFLIGAGNPAPATAAADVAPVPAVAVDVPFDGAYVVNAPETLPSGPYALADYGTVRYLANKYRCRTDTTIVLARYQGNDGTALMLDNTIWVAPDLWGARLHYVVAHECAHMLAAWAYGGDQQGVNEMTADMNTMYGGSGWSGMEQNADCITVMLGLTTQSYTTWCSGNRAWAAKEIWEGRRLTPPKVSGALASRYYATGGPADLGQPIGNMNCWLKNGGCYQPFQRGDIFYTHNTGAHVMRGGINVKWRSTGFENGWMGYPVSSEMCGLRDGGCYQIFEGGHIFWSARSGAWTMSQGAINNTWRLIGAENSILGYPVWDQVCGLSQGGCYQSFQYGAIFWTPQTGAQVLFGGINATWRQTGFEIGPLGYPTSSELPAPGGVVQNFQGGRIFWSSRTDSVVFPNNSPLVAGFDNAGGLQMLGVPTSREFGRLPGGGVGMNFVNGQVFWSAASGSHAVVNSKISVEWNAAAGLYGKYGYPTGPMTCDAASGVCTQQFQGGTITK